MYTPSSRWWGRLCPVLLAALVLLASGCDLFLADDGRDGHVIDEEAFFYMVDRETVTLHMLDSQLREVRRWELAPVVQDSSIQGITFDGEHLWVAVAGSADELFQLDLGGDEAAVRHSLEAPPTGSGTVRDIAWDGTYLWAVNNGSVTNDTPPALYQLDPETGSVVAEYTLPSPEPRALSFIPPNDDVYGRSAPSGLYYGDREIDAFYNLRMDRRVFVDAFPAPVSPQGEFRVFPSGLTYELVDGALNFWALNSSLGANYLFRLDRNGEIEEQFELPPSYRMPGPIVHVRADLRLRPAPVIEAVAPNRGGRDTDVTVSVLGEHFVAGDGLAVDFGPGIAVDEVTFVDAATLEVELTIAADAELGVRSVTVTMPDGQQATLEEAFEVLAEAPALGFLWVVDFSDNRLYKVREAGGALVQQWNTRAVAPGGSPQGVASDGESVWLSAAGSDDAIYRLDVSGTTLTADDALPAPPNESGTIRDITFHEGYLWAVNSSEDRIYQLDPDDGSILDDVPTPGSNTRGVVFVDDRLYATDQDLGQVLAFDASGGGWDVQFTVPLPDGVSADNLRPGGIAWDGEAFWIATSRFSDDYLLRVSTEGELLDSFTSPNVGDDILMGLTFTRER